MYVYLYIYINIYICILYTYIYIYIYIYFRYSPSSDASNQQTTFPEYITLQFLLLDNDNSVALQYKQSTKDFCTISMYSISNHDGK